ncbi:MAG: ACR3 family arsenite efflux transporter [Candidatus Heimdallarchaeota archaeon]|nr:MAG: ACR3 family arsenite efflux transporter [Candidatus Heimdallarchaeota archaeon]
MSETKGITKEMSFLDKFLPVFILVAMAIGIVLSQIVPDIQKVFEFAQIDTVSLPIAIGLLWMMYPVLAKVQYEKIPEALKEYKLFGTSIFQNWVLGPIFMFVLAWIFLADFEGYRQGIILVGLARCIAMVLIWNMLAGGDSEKCAILVALNSVFQIFFYTIYAWIFIGEIDLDFLDIARSVFIFLGIPLIAGFMTREILRRKKGDNWYNSIFIPKLGPTAIIGLLFTVIAMFSMQGEKILAKPFDILRISIPLLIYFIGMFLISFLISILLKFKYAETVTLSFTAASNNFELAIAVAIATFGINTDQALATVVGPLIEVPVLLLLVYLALWLKKYLFKNEMKIESVKKEVSRS